MALAFYPFIVLAAVGLGLSVLVHVLSMVGYTFSHDTLVWGLHIGVLVVWGPALIAAQRALRPLSLRHFWGAVLRGCPFWMRMLVYGVLAYAMVNFGMFTIEFLCGDILPTGKTPASVFRGFSGQWLALYAGALGILYAAVHRTSDRGRRCPNNHVVSFSSKYCQECGSRV